MTRTHAHAGAAKEEERMRMRAIHLYRQGDYTIVAVEARKGVWVEVIREPYDNAFSHIVEPSGIEARIAAHREPIESLIARSSVGAALADIKERGIDAHLADLENDK